MTTEHKKLIEHLPPFLAEYREYRRLFGVLQDEVDDIIAKAEKALNNTFPALADEEGISHWERMLGITPVVASPLDDRREVIRMKLAGERPYTFRKLTELLDKLLGVDGYHIEETAAFEMTVLVALTSRIQYAAAEDLLNRILPANISLTLGLLYRQHDYFNGIYTHDQMAAYTHAGLREVIPDE